MQSLYTLPQITQRIVQTIEKEKTPVFLLEGPMGVGKTFLVKTVLKEFGINDVLSPTFVLMRVYKNHNREFAHLDLYRLREQCNKSCDDVIEELSLFDYVGVMPSFIEWPIGIEETLHNVGFDKGLIHKIRIIVNKNQERRYEYN